MIASSRSLAAAIGLVLSCAIPAFLAAGLAPQIRGDFGFSDAAVGVVVAIFFTVSALASRAAGRIVDRIGAVASVRVTALFNVTATLAIAAFASSPATLAAFLAIAGLANALATPAVNALLRRDVPSHRLGAAFGVQTAGASLSGLLAGLAVPLVALPFGWQWAFVCTAALALAAAAMAGAPKPATPGRAPAPARPQRADRAVVTLAIATGLASGAAIALVSFAVLYATHLGIDAGAAGLVLAGLGGGAALGRIVTGFLADRTEDPLSPVLVTLIGGTAGFVLVAAGGTGPLIVGAALAGTLGWGWHGAMTLAVVRRGSHAPAASVGLMMVGNFAGAVAGPLAAGALADRDAFTALWIGCAVCMAAAAVLVAATRRHASVINQTTG